MFESLYEGFAEITQVAAPTLVPHDDGSMAFHLDWRDVTVDVMYIPAKSQDHVFAFFAMGPIAEGNDEARIMRALLEANFLALRPEPLVFGCHPRTGDAALMRTLPMNASGPGYLAGQMDEGVDMVLLWRQNYFLDRSNA